MEKRALELSSKYKTLLNKYNVNTPLRLAHFFAQIAHESKLKPINENLNYSYDRLLVIFKSDFDVNKDRILSSVEKAFAETIANKPILIGNFVYANQNGNGSVSTGDGYKFRGRGFIQITGKSNYKNLSKDTGIDFVNKPDLLLEEVNSMVAALWFWDTNRLNTYADNDDVKTVTRKINGGYNGLDDRKRLIDNFKKIFK